MSDIRRVDFYPNDWIAGIATLDVVDVGIFATAEAVMYSHGGPIQKADLKRFVRCHGKAFENALARLVASGRLILNGSQISSKRCLNELEKARERIAKWSENGSKGGRPSKEINDLPKPNGSYARANPPTTNHQEEDTSVPSGTDGACAPPKREPVDLVKALFDRGKEALGQKSGDVLGKMRRQYGDVAVLEAIVACEDTSPSNPVAFFVAVLNRRNGRAAKLSPVAKLYAGAYEAGEEWDRRQGNRGARYSLDGALLDSGRPH